MFNLVCVHPFANFVRGQLVEDQEEVAAITADDRIQYFNRVPRPVVEVPQAEEQHEETEHDGE